MSLYVDTSVLAAFYCREAGSTRAEKALRGGQALALSSLVKLELASATAKKVRNGAFDQSFARQLLSLFHAHLRDGHFELLPVEEADVALADEWICSLSTPLRTLDALHLAIAFRAGLTLLTADRALVTAARALKIPCRRP
ncbi:MAG: type II toxin-antitoxin system VapC family toxin [Planctomycetota bacterium]